MSKPNVIFVGMSDDQALDRLFEDCRDPRLDSLKPDESVPKVGDTVVLNDTGLEQCFGHASGLAHMKTLEMKVTSVDPRSMTYPVPTFVLEVDNLDINRFMLDNHCFDILRSAK